MTVAKIFERAAPLLIAEEIIPAEFRNIGVPFKAQWDPRYRPKTDGD
jgi:hypothetical protein